MNKAFILNTAHDYFNGKITRSDLSLIMKNHRTASPFAPNHDCSFASLLLDGIEQKLSAIPEESYPDDELRHIIEVLEGGRAAQDDFVYVIPRRMINGETERLIQITEQLLCHFEQGKTHTIKVRVPLTNREVRSYDSDSFFTQEDYDFCKAIRNTLSHGTRDTVLKSVVWNLLSMINRLTGDWEGIATYFPSREALRDDILLEDIKRSLQALCGKRPIYVSLSGMIDHIHATIFVS